MVFYSLTWPIALTDARKFKVLLTVDATHSDLIWVISIGVIDGAVGVDGDVIINSFIVLESGSIFIVPFEKHLTRRLFTAAKAVFKYWVAPDGRIFQVI